MWFQEALQDTKIKKIIMNKIAKITPRQLNELKPTVWIGKKGITPTLYKEIKLQLETRGYIKGKILKSMRDEFDFILKQVINNTECSLVSKKGLTFILSKKEE